MFSTCFGCGQALRICCCMGNYINAFCGPCCGNPDFTVGVDDTHRGPLRAREMFVLPRVREHLTVSMKTHVRFVEGNVKCLLYRNIDESQYMPKLENGYDIFAGAEVIILEMKKDVARVLSKNGVGWMYGFYLIEQIPQVE